MPHVTIDVVSMDAVPLPVARSCRFDSPGGTIGRDETNTLVLPDKYRRVSRSQATVAFSADGPSVTNSSTSLSISVGEKVLEFGQSLPLTVGCALEIGPYILNVSSIMGSDDSGVPGVCEPLPDKAVDPPKVTAQEIPLPSSQGLTVESEHQPRISALPSSAGAQTGYPPVDSDPFASLLAGIGSSPAIASPAVEQFMGQRSGAQHAAGIQAVGLNDPLAGFLQSEPARVVQPNGSQSAISMDPLAALGFGLASGGGDFARASPQNAAAPLGQIPQEFNPFELPSGVSRNSADPLASLLGVTTAPETSVVNRGGLSIDSLFSSTGASDFSGSTSESPAGSLWQTGSQSLLPSEDNVDPLLLFGGSAQPSDHIARPVRDDLAEIGGAYQPPRAFAPKAVSPLPKQDSAFGESMSSASGTGSPPEADLLTRAFLKGANLAPNALPQGLTPEIMALVGSLLRTATSGAVDMLAARTATKLEVQADVTMISAQANNPLKFLPNGEVALQQLLGRKMPGFMPPDEAMKDAFDDLRAHEIGVIAGTRAALTEVLGKFDPAIIGEQIAAGSFLESLSAWARKAKLWDVYLDRYSDIRREAEDDFQSIFGRAFVQAYERETARMKLSKSMGGRTP